MQTRRNEIRALFTAIFAFLGYFKGFGMWLGGALGIVTGDAVAKISQSGLEDKVKKDEDNDKENK